MRTSRWGSRVVVRGSQYNDKGAVGGIHRAAHGLELRGQVGMVVGVSPAFGQ